MPNGTGSGEMSAKSDVRAVSGKKSCETSLVSRLWPSKILGVCPCCAILSAILSVFAGIAAGGDMGFSRFTELEFCLPATEGHSADNAMTSETANSKYDIRVNTSDLVTRAYSSCSAQIISFCG